MSQRCFRPLAGIVVLNRKQLKIATLVSIPSFRPLLGIEFLNIKARNWIDCKLNAFPSPYGD